MKKILKNLPVVGPIFTKIGAFIRLKRNNIIWFSLYWKNRNALAQNRELKDSMRGRRCFILATGPSINETDIPKLKGELSISVSDFYVHPDFHLIRPEFHLFPGSHSPITDEQFKMWFEDAGEKMPVGQKVFVALTDKPIVDRYHLFQKQKVYYYFAGTKSLDRFKAIDFTKQLPDIKTSPHTAMYLAFYLGCTDIKLLGIDHTWIPNDNKPIKDHFYENEQSAIYRAGWRPREKAGSLEGAFRGYLKLWDGYKPIIRYAKKNGIGIANCSPNSLLDLFPKETFMRKGSAPEQAK